MKEMSEFPYGEQRTEENPMHGHMLLLETSVGLSDQFVIGYYDAVYDIFQACYSPFQQTADNRYDECQITSPTHWCDDYYCIMPRQFTDSRGSRCFTGFMPLDEVLANMRDRDMFDSNIKRIVKEAKFSTPYLLVTRDRRVIISTVCNFTEGKSFSASYPIKIAGNVYHMNSLMQAEKIRYAVNLLEFKNMEMEV